MRTKTRVASVIAITSFDSDSLSGFYVIKESQSLRKKTDRLPYWIAPKTYYHKNIGMSIFVISAKTL